jgi:hypothetical protein
MFQSRAQGEIACRTDASNAEFLSFEVSCLGDGGIGDQREDHLMNGRSHPGDIGALSPSCHHRRW